VPVLISFLRGVNVTGKNLIKMDQLRALYEELGFTDVRSYLQSGNVVFKTRERALPRLAKRIQDAIEARFGCRPAVMFRTVEEMRDTIARNPFAGRTDVAPGYLIVMFLAEACDDASRKRVALMDTAGEELHAGEHELYIHFRGGMGQSKLSTLTLEKMLKTAGTARNWNTVTNLLAMAEEMTGAAQNPGTLPLAKRK
jgi:uncharacterized protein (DUF1697 family)